MKLASPELWLGIGFFWAMSFFRALFHPVACF